MKTKIMLAIAAIALLPVNPATAAVSVFDFSTDFLVENNVEGQAFSPVSGNANLTVTPTGNFVGGTDAENMQADAYQVDWGLGVHNQNDPTGDRSSLFNRVHVDAVDGQEFLRLEFSDDVQITKAVFAFVGAFEKFDLAIDGQDIDVAAEFGSDVIADLTPQGMIRGTVLFPDSLPFGSVWDFITTGPADEWNIEAVEVVPEPAALLVWSGLSLAIGWRYRRRKKRSA